MRYAKWVAGVAVVCCLGAVSLGQATQPGDLAALLGRLGSNDFAVRDGAQKELDKLPAARVEELRAAARATTDAEVKSRLEARIDAIELDAIMHPKPLTVQVENKNLNEVAKQINDQLGFRYLVTTQDRTTAITNMTIHAEDQPLWEILRQADGHGDFMIFTRDTQMAPVGQQMYVVFSGPAGGGEALPVTVIDGIGITAQTTGSPAKGNWTLMCHGFLDPRIRVASYSSLRVDKAVDQDGRALKQVAGPDDRVITAYRAMPAFSTSATFAAAPGVTAIKELHGAVTLKILVTEKIITMDLNDLPKEPLDTPMGKLTAEKTAAGDYVVRVTPPEDGMGGAGSLQVRLVSASGRVTTYNTMNVRGGVTIGARGVPADAQKLEIPMAEKVREVTVPIALENVAISPDRPPMRGGGR